MTKTATFVQTFSMAAAAFLLIAASAAAQTSAPATSAKTTDANKTWKVPRTPDGHPSFEGVWANNSVTPLQRPPQWAGKTTLSDAEVQDLKRRIAAIDPGGDALFRDNLVLTALSEKKQISAEPTTGDYNQFWLEDRDIDNRTSLITDPADGKIPPLTAEAEQLRTSRPRRNGDNPAGPEDLGLTVRCVTFGFPRTEAAYDSYFQITQAHDAVAIMGEADHEARVISTSNAPHMPSDVRFWLGDSRGHWEGDTLVVDTTNFRPDTDLNGATQNLHVIERYTRVSEDYLNWEITWIDPHTWTKPWTEMIRLKLSKNQLYEYACHEGNYSEADILAGARADEKKSAEAVTKKSQVQ